MRGSYDAGVAHASLMQLNEISRRAEAARMSFGAGAGPGGVPAGTGGGSAGVEGSGGILGREGEDTRDPARILAAAVGLMGWDEDTSRVGKRVTESREDALARIEELQRNRPASAQGIGVAGLSGFEPVVVGGSDTFVIPEDAEEIELGAGPGASMQAWGGGDGSSAGGSGGGAVPGTGTAGASTHQGLKVYTLGHLMPKNNGTNQSENWSLELNSLGGVGMSGTDDGDGTNVTALAGTSPSTSGPGFTVPDQPVPETAYTDNDDVAAEETVPPSPTAPRSGDVVPPSGQAPPPASSSSSQKLRVRRSAFVPGWAVPPRVLLVDDDAVSRRLSSKFLQVFGCTIDVAVDGVGAVNKMNLEKYDLVLMVHAGCPLATFSSFDTDMLLLG
jgi:osomolarity two-component system response regulator SKN7